MRVNKIGYQIKFNANNRSKRNSVNKNNIAFKSDMYYEWALKRAGSFDKLKRFEQIGLNLKRNGIESYFRGSDFKAECVQKVIKIFENLFGMY